MIAESRLPQQLGTRAVLADIPIGSNAVCPQCHDEIRYNSQKKLQRVISNVYAFGKWQYVVEYHAFCYTKAGQPHGPLILRS